MEPWSSTPFPAVLWVKSYCVDRGEYVDSWRTDSPLWCLGTRYGHYVTLQPSTLGADIPWSCTATSHLPWSKGRWGGGGTSQKAEHQDADQSQVRMYTHQEGMVMICQHKLYQQVPSLPWEYRSSVDLALWSTHAPGPALADLITSVHLHNQWSQETLFACVKIIPWCHPEGLYVQMPAQTPQVQCDLVFPIREGKKRERKK